MTSGPDIMRAAVAADRRDQSQKEATHVGDAISAAGEHDRPMTRRLSLTVIALVMIAFAAWITLETSALVGWT